MAQIPESLRKQYCDTSDEQIERWADQEVNALFPKPEDDAWPSPISIVEPENKYKIAELAWEQCGTYSYELTKEHLETLSDGKLIAFDNHEYMFFLRLKK